MTTPEEKVCLRKASVGLHRGLAEGGEEDEEDIESGSRGRKMRGRRRRG